MGVNPQFYSQLREAMFENRLTASDISQRKGVHYTYVYNTIRKNANITLETAQQLADAAGYDLQMTFVPRGESAPLTGKMEPVGPLYTARRPRKPRDADKKSSEEPAAQLPASEVVQLDVEDEINELLAMAGE